MNSFDHHIKEAKGFLDDAVNGHDWQMAVQVAQVEATLAVAHALQDIAAILRGEVPSSLTVATVRVD